MAITKIFHQQCKSCETDCEPEFVDLLLCLARFFSWLRDLDDSSDSYDDQAPLVITAPHEYDLCEICDYGANPHDH